MSRSQNKSTSNRTRKAPPQGMLFEPEHPGRPTQQPRQGPDDALEQAARARYGPLIAGVDEVGRGPLAGPVVTAAVILDPDTIPQGLDDSKKLKMADRERLFDQICTSAHVGVASASPDQIDQLNIRGATLWAMTKALNSLPVAPSFALFDGRDVAPGAPCPGQHVIKGDGRSLSIAAASIVAKVVRDRLMIRMGSQFPGYGFETHMGYGTRAHLEALDRLGICCHHRRSFRPIYERLRDTQTD